MDAAAEIGRNPVTKWAPDSASEYGEWASRRERWNNRTRFARPNSQARFPVQLTMSRTGNLAGLIHTLLKVLYAVFFKKNLNAVYTALKGRHTAHHRPRLFTTHRWFYRTTTQAPHAMKTQGNYYPAPLPFLVLFGSPAMNYDHAVSWGRGVWVSVSDINRVGQLELVVGQPELKKKQKKTSVLLFGLGGGSTESCVVNRRSLIIR